VNGGGAKASGEEDSGAQRNNTEAGSSGYASVAASDDIRAAAEVAALRNAIYLSSRCGWTNIDRSRQQQQQQQPQKTVGLCPFIISAREVMLSSALLID